MMTLPQLIFYIFASLTILSAVMIVSQSNPVRCVLFLVFAFFSSSVLWLLIHAEFLALILVLVYVGAVMTLFLFVVMMLNIDVESMKAHFWKYLPLGFMIVAGLVGLLYITLPHTGIFGSEYLAATPTHSNTQTIGLVLYTHYVLAFEAAAVILLVAIIAAITLTHRATSSNSKRQSILKQIMVRREDRITLVAMNTEAKKDTP